MKVIIAAILMGTFACLKSIHVPPTKRPETPVYDDGKHKDPLHALYWIKTQVDHVLGGNKIGNSKFLFKILPLNGDHLPIYALNLILFS